METICWNVVFTFVISAVLAQYGLNEQNAPACHPALPAHLNGLTGEELIKQLDAYYITLIDQALAIADANAGKPLNNNTGFFLSIILETQQAVGLIVSIVNGSMQANENNCLTIVNATVNNIFAAIAHANDVIPGGTCEKLTGEGKYQYLLQQFGQAWSLALALTDANMNTPYPGVFLQHLIAGSKNLRLMQTVANGQAGPFNATACLLTLQELAVPRNEFTILG